MPVSTTLETHLQIANRIPVVGRCPVRAPRAPVPSTASRRTTTRPTAIAPERERQPDPRTRTLHLPPSERARLASLRAAAHSRAAPRGRSSQVSKILSLSFRSRVGVSLWRDRKAQSTSRRSRGVSESAICTEVFLPVEKDKELCFSFEWRSETLRKRRLVQSVLRVSHRERERERERRLSSCVSASGASSQELSLSRSAGLSSVSRLDGARAPASNSQYPIFACRPLYLRYVSSVSDLDV